MLVAAAILASLAASIGGLLLWIDKHIRPGPDDPVKKIEDLLPRIQCGQCGFAGCTPYAVAVAGGNAAINLCPPGGQETADQLATLLGRERLPLDTERGSATLNQVAQIDEAVCIGCNRCVPACPVDAIVGAHHFMHTVLADECTGCELCLAPCPVDCINLQPRQQAVQ